MCEDEKKKTLFFFVANRKALKIISQQRAKAIIRTMPFEKGKYNSHRLVEQCVKWF
jgi:hypothetical protein